MPYIFYNVTLTRLHNIRPGLVSLHHITANIPPAYSLMSEKSHYAFRVYISSTCTNDSFKFIVGHVRVTDLYATVCCGEEKSLSRWIFRKNPRGWYVCMLESPKRDAKFQSDRMGHVGGVTNGRRCAFVRSQTLRAFMIYHFFKCLCKICLDWDWWLTKMRNCSSSTSRGNDGKVLPPARAAVRPAAHSPSTSETI